MKVRLPPASYPSRGAAGRDELDAALLRGPGRDQKQPGAEAAKVWRGLLA